MTNNATLDLNFPACLASDFPIELPIAMRAVDDVLAVVQHASFETLVERSPGLRDNDWSNYLRCSLSPMVHAASALHRRGVSAGRIIDYGSYFGNFALMFADMGYEVDAIDSYEVYGPALRPVVDALAKSRVRVLDFAEIGRDLALLPAESYDAILCMGVVEHIPDSPRGLLDALDRVLKPGGALLLETPNLAHLYNRQKLARGEAIMTPLEVQYYASLPFEGHHREYTAAEVVWMVQQLRHNVLMTDLYNYSAYGHGILTGRDVNNHWRMVADPTMRELILVMSRKLAEGESFMPVTHWESTIESVEHYWERLAPASSTREDGDAIVATELLLVELQKAVVTRDEMLAALHREKVQDVAVRDADIAALNAALGDLQRRFDAKASERARRLWRRLQRAR